jgi:hypothetical protein
MTDTIWYDVLTPFILVVGMCCAFEYGRLWGFEQGRKITEHEVRRTLGLEIQRIDP